MDAVVELNAIALQEQAMPVLMDVSGAYDLQKQHVETVIGNVKHDKKQQKQYEKRLYRKRVIHCPNDIPQKHIFTDNHASAYFRYAPQSVLPEA